jgi:hypothetical protein
VTVTVKDVAKAAGVSTTTVSRVTNAAGKVKPETELRVLDVISRLSYRPNPVAVDLKRCGTVTKARSSAGRPAQIFLERTFVENTSEGCLRPLFPNSAEDLHAIGDLASLRKDAESWRLFVRLLRNLGYRLFESGEENEHSAVEASHKAD